MKSHQSFDSNKFESLERTNLERVFRWAADAEVELVPSLSGVLHTKLKSVVVLEWQNFYPGKTAQCWFLDRRFKKKQM